MPYRSRGFTLIEVMVAVVILAFSATAALKLVLYAENGLSAVREKRDLIQTAVRIETEVRAGKLEKCGTSGDYSWETETQEADFFGEDFGKLNFKDKSGDKGSGAVENSPVADSIKSSDKKSAASGDSVSGSSVSGDSGEDTSVSWKKLTVKYKDELQTSFVLPGDKTEEETANGGSASADVSGDKKGSKSDNNKDNN